MKENEKEKDLHTEAEVQAEEVQDNEATVEAEESTEEEEQAEPIVAEVVTPEEEMEARLAEQEDKYLRLRAEFENFRKRTIKEKAELILNGSEKSVQALLPIVDDMERALANGEKIDDAATLREGMELIYKKLMKALEGLGVKPIEAVGKDFDTDFHEAIAMVPGMGDDNKGKVVDCVKTGYLLNDKVIRHAQVAVGQ